MSLWANRLSDIGSENAFRIGARIAKIEAEGHTVARLNLGEPDFNVPICIKETIKQELDKNNTHYCDPKGIIGLREGIARFISETRGIPCDAEQVVVYPGLKPAIPFAVQAYCNPGDEVIYPVPGYAIYESFISFIGAKAVPLRLLEHNGFSVEADQLESLLTPKTKLIFLNFPSNPTGGVATLKQLEQLAEVILKKCSKNVRVFSDEIYERIIFDGLKHYSIASIPGMEKITIMGSGFSKGYAWTGGRVGYAVYPTIEEADIFKNLNINYFSCIPAYNQEAARVALFNKEAEQDIQHMVSVFQKRRDFALEKLREIPGIKVNKPSGAFYLFPNIENPLQELGAIEAYQKLPVEAKAKTTPSTLFQIFALHHHHVAIMDRRSFGAATENEHYVRVSIASEEHILEEGIARLKRAFQDKEGFKAYLSSRP